MIIFDLQLFIINKGTIYFRERTEDNKISFLRVKTFSLTLREEHRLAVFEKRVLRRILEVRVEWVKLHNEEFRYIYIYRLKYIVHY
jgi:hypothetical protein